MKRTSSLRGTSVGGASIEKPDRYEETRARYPRGRGEHTPSRARAGSQGRRVVSVLTTRFSRRCQFDPSSHFLKADRGSENAARATARRSRRRARVASSTAAEPRETRETQRCPPRYVSSAARGRDQTKHHGSVVDPIGPAGRAPRAQDLRDVGGQRRTCTIPSCTIPSFNPRTFQIPRPAPTKSPHSWHHPI